MFGEKRFGDRQAGRFPAVFLAGCMVLLLLGLGAPRAWAEWPHVAISGDGTSISYET